jgi:hypothetical protein
MRKPVSVDLRQLRPAADEVSAQQACDVNSDRSDAPLIRHWAFETSPDGTSRAWLECIVTGRLHSRAAGPIGSGRDRNLRTVNGEKKLHPPPVRAFSGSGAALSRPVKSLLEMTRAGTVQQS